MMYSVSVHKGDNHSYVIEVKKITDYAVTASISKMF